MKVKLHDFDLPNEVFKFKLNLFNLQIYALLGRKHASRALFENFVFILILFLLLYYEEYKIFFWTTFTTKKKSNRLYKTLVQGC